MARSEPNSPSSPSSPSSLKQKLKTTFGLFTSLRKNQHGCQPQHPGHHLSISSPEKHSPRGEEDGQGTASPPKDNVLSPRDKAKQFISRIGRRGSGGHHRRHSASADFRYDAMSYALNFDDGAEESPSGDDPLRRNFSSRLPPSPTRDIRVSVG